MTIEKIRHKGVFYFRTYQMALRYAESRGYPTDRLVHYHLGWAIQLRRSGPYVG